MKKYSIAIFDFDGVIVNSESIRLNTYKILFKNQFDISIKFSDKDLIGKSEEHNLFYLLKKYNLDIKIATLQNNRKKILDSVICDIHLNSIIKDIVEELFALKIPLFIASSSSKKYILNILNNLNIKYYFKEIFGSEDTNKKKPNPEIYLKIKNKYKLCNTDILVFEDSPVGISASRNANMDCVGVLSSFKRNDLKNANYYLNFNKLDEVKTIINLFK